MDDLLMEDDKALMLFPPLPPAELAEAWTKIEPQIQGKPGLRAAILWSMHGESLREASKRGGISKDTLNHWLRKLGVHAESWATKQLVGTHRRVAILASEELERRLIHTPEELKPAELNFIAGTSTDKVSKFERWGERPAEAPSYASALEKLATALADGKVSLKIEVAQRETVADPVTIDVTPA